MNLKLKLITLTGAMLFSFSTVKAQTANTSSFTPSHIQAAEKLFVAIGIDKQFSGMMDNMVNTTSAQIPADKRAAFVGVMQKFMDKYFTWDLLKDKMANIYAEEFTEDELNQLIIFYNSPLGQKVSSRMSALMQKGMVIGQEAVSQHKDELEQMMKEAFGEPATPAVKKSTNKTPVRH